MIQITNKYVFKHFHILFAFSFVYFIGTDGKALKKYVTCLSHCSPNIVTTQQNNKTINSSFGLVFIIIKY